MKNILLLSLMLALGACASGYQNYYDPNQAQAMNDWAMASQMISNNINQQVQMRQPQPVRVLNPSYNTSCNSYYGQLNCTTQQAGPFIMGR